MCFNEDIIIIVHRFIKLRYTCVSVDSVIYTAVNQYCTSVLNYYTHTHTHTHTLFTLLWPEFRIGPVSGMAGMKQLKRKKNKSSFHVQTCHLKRYLLII